jgi:hypothetical protein
MATTTTAAAQVGSANKFELVSESGKTKITYFPTASGPISPSVGVGPSLLYAGPEGTVEFRGDQVNHQDNRSGTLLTVVVKPPFENSYTAFSLFVPPVTVRGRGDVENFTTYGVTAHHLGLVEKLGTQITYQVQCFKGKGESVILAD